MHFLNIASGSSGNATYIGSDDTHILVDCGVSCKKIVEGLDLLHLTIQDIKAILITHEHIDHIKGLGVFLRKHPVPVYSTHGTINGILACDKLGELDGDLFKVIKPDISFQIGDLNIEASSIWHDAADPVCYSVSDENGRAVVATDLGDYDEYLINKLSGADCYLVESNHDVRMLEANQRYSWTLKQRILGRCGHLSNERSGEFMTEIVKKSPPKYIVLGHLSRDNNIPECALINMENYMREAGVDLEKTKIFVASRTKPTAEVSI
ncbi:MAG: MBL fold metallo-hydrolase [Lachnospiraceae bacterium]|nr:MBL fold metallo-hydrolase [Lachnospiraceae bacterium]